MSLRAILDVTAERCPAHQKICCSAICALHALKAFPLACRLPEDDDDSEGRLLDTARGPRGAYHDAPRGGQRAAQLDGGRPSSVRPHVWVRSDPEAYH